MIFKTQKSYAEALARVDAAQLPLTVPEMLEVASQRYGAATAVRFFEDGAELTFSELSKCVDRLAQGLHELGIGHGTHVATLLPNRIEYPVVWLALTRLGAVSVPLITRLTPREIRFIVEDADVTHLVFDDAYRSLLDDGSQDAVFAPGHMIVVGARAHAGESDYAQLISASDGVFSPPRQVSAGDLLSIQYTSGTTGMPKGVMLSHRFWIEVGCAPILFWPLADLKTLLSDHPFYYIDPQWMLVCGLYTGARVDFSRGMSVSRFMSWLRTQKSELAWFPDPLLKTAEQTDDAHSPVRVFMAYGLSKDTLEQAERRYGTRVREAFGMTEIGFGLGVPWESDDPAIRGTCGLPGPWRECRIVDESGQVVPDGTMGELQIRGPGICAGYYNRPEVNATTFVDGWFRTGDLFVRDEHGYYSIVGRLKEMIKRSGENIAAAEVERALLELECVQDAAVVPVPDPDRDEEVKAYIKLRLGLSSSDFPPDVVLAHCRERLARFKVPRYVAYVDQFPYTPSEKVAKKKLVEGIADLRVGSFDAVDGLWR